MPPTQKAWGEENHELLEFFLLFPLFVLFFLLLWWVCEDGTDTEVETRKIFRGAMQHFSS